MPLTDLKVRTAKVQSTPYKLSDSGGLFLLITPKGSKYWRFKYRFEGKEKLLALGVYPLVSLAEAREKRDQAKKQRTQGIDACVFKKVAKQAPKTVHEEHFEFIAREWHLKSKPHWTEDHSNLVLRKLENYIFPWIGKRSMRDITAAQLLEALRPIERKGALETARRTRQICGQIFRYAVATGRAERDISVDLRGALIPPKVTHFASIIEPKKVGALLRAMRGYEGNFATQCALRLAPLVFVRPGILRTAEWSEMDLNQAAWHVPARKMKNRKPHWVPLSRQALALIQNLQPFTGHGPYLFPSLLSPKRPMSDNTINAALKRLGYESTELTGHGFRAMARTLLDEILGVRPDIIEHQLAHTVKDPLGRAYNRTSHLPLRIEMMQQWADYLDTLEADVS